MGLDAAGVNLVLRGRGLLMRRIVFSKLSGPHRFMMLCASVLVENSTT